MYVYVYMYIYVYIYIYIYIAAVVLCVEVRCYISRVSTCCCYMQ